MNKLLRENSRQQRLLTESLQSSDESSKEKKQKSLHGRDILFFENYYEELRRLRRSPSFERQSETKASDEAIETTRYSSLNTQNSFYQDVNSTPQPTIKNKGEADAGARAGGGMIDIRHHQHYRGYRRYHHFYSYQCDS